MAQRRRTLSDLKAELEARKAKGEAERRRIEMSAWERKRQDEARKKRDAERKAYEAAQRLGYYDVALTDLEASDWFDLPYQRTVVRMDDAASPLMLFVEIRKKLKLKNTWRQMTDDIPHGVLAWVPARNPLGMVVVCNKLTPEEYGRLVLRRSMKRNPSQL